MMKTALKNYDLQLYAEDTCILYSHRNVTFIKRIFNLCEWFIDNRLSIHFGEDKTKNILFKRRNKSNLSIIITRNENIIKQHSVVEYLGCLLDENMSGETVARIVLKRLTEKRYFVIDRVDICHIFLFMYYFSSTALWFCMLLLVFKFVNVTENGQLRILVLSAVWS